MAKRELKHRTCVYAHLQKLCEVCPVGAGRELPVDVQPIKAVLPEEGDGVVSEQLTVDTAAADGLKVCTASAVASHSQQHLQLGVRVLQTQHAAVQVCNRLSLNSNGCTGLQQVGSKL